MGVAVADGGQQVGEEATGEAGNSPRIVVWDADTMQTKAILTGTLRRGVICLAFNTTGTLLCGLSSDECHTLAIYNWAQQRLISVAPVERRRVVGEDAKRLRDGHAEPRV